MKLLVAFALVQILALTFLGVRLLEIEARMNEFAAIVRVQSQPESAAPSTGSPSASGLAASDVRRIFREEIAALPTLKSASRNNPAASPAPAPPTAEDARLASTVRLEIQNYISRGKIGHADMAALQMKIARLPPRERTQALNALTKAMNSGDVEGQF